MDRKLDWEIRAISNDDRSGAAEIALRTVGAVEQWLKRCPKPTKNQLLGLTCHLLQTHVAMAPMTRLANAVALAAEAQDPALQLKGSCQEFRRILRTAPRAIATQFKKALGKGPRKLAVTYSYSSTVLRALIHSRGRLWGVACAEGRPAYEGREMARRLAKAGIRVFLSTDAGIFGSLVAPEDSYAVLVLGADQIGGQGFVNKAGTQALLSFARDQRAPIMILADSMKFVNQRRGGLTIVSRTGKRVWANPPKGVQVSDHDFCICSYPASVRILTERGWYSKEGVQRKVRKIRFSPWIEKL